MVAKMLPIDVMNCGMCPYFSFLGRSAQEPDKKLYLCKYRTPGVEHSLIWTVPINEEPTYTIPENCPLEAAPEPEPEPEQKSKPTTGAPLTLPDSAVSEAPPTLTDRPVSDEF